MQIDRIKKYLIDVEYNPWRTAIVQQRFLDTNLEVERYCGIHGTTVGILPLRTVWDAEQANPYRISPGQMSITISKLMVFERALLQPGNEFIFFENDVKFCDNFKEEFEKSYNALPGDWQACHIGHCCSEGKPQTRINDRVTEIVGVLCCHALMFKREALELIVKEFRRCDWGTPSDTILARKVYPKLRHYCFTPQLAFQDQTTSEAAKYEVYTDVQGWTTPDILAIYDEQLTGFDNRHCVAVEVGTWRGRSAVYMASEIKRRLKSVEFFCVDSWLGSASDAEAMNPMIEDLNNRYGGDGLYKDFIHNINRCGVADWIKPLRMPSVEAATKFSDRSVDFVYIDAGHDYDSVLADLRAWMPKMRPGSTMAGHDIARASVKQAVAEFSAKIGKPWRQFGESWLIDGCNV